MKFDVLENVAGNQSEPLLVLIMLIVIGEVIIQMNNRSTKEMMLRYAAYIGVLLVIALGVEFLIKFFTGSEYDWSIAMIIWFCEIGLGFLMMGGRE